MRADQQRAYIIHTRPYRETSLLVDAFTEEFGRVSLVAKGARQAKSRQRHLLQPFTPVLLSWLGKGSLKTLTEVESTQSSFQLHDKYLFSGFYANELLHYLCKEDDVFTELFHLYESLLVALADEQDLPSTLRFFEFTLLSELGYGVDFFSEAISGQPIQNDAYYRYIPESGFILSQDSSKNCFKGEFLYCIGEGDYSGESAAVAKKIARQALHFHLNGREIKSRQLFK